MHNMADTIYIRYSCGKITRLFNNRRISPLCTIRVYF